ncbi:hypothetical protein E2K98_23605 [Bacillus salipaludis]|uniref:Uncharacterized protein n=1 Tax=Bacillus salipaludis TaxID=2547811 RepID=A0A4R5VKF4_9BACI|nr:hypothetical protein [Bacillus salipaludis]MDQ6596263.1 hypothetical protein [Bacillus salipaludis]TDK58419.1 hypothetical protein E2K98_23605 [Bacillus salipaludis]
MKKLKYWGATAVIGLLIGTAFWWATSKVKDLKDPLNKSDAFVYSDNGILHWFELTSRRGEVKGKLHQQRFIEKAGKAPIMEEKLFPLTGETTEKGYKFKLNNGGEIISYEAWFSGPHLSVQEQGEKDITLYNPVNHKELDGYIKALKDYHAEENENKRIRYFFSNLRSVYGYLYTAQDDSFQLFVKIDEALLEGELTGYLLMMDDKGKESRYVLNGVTDGRLVKFFTTVDGKTTKLEGKFHEGATGFDLSFWTTDQKLSFHAVTKEVFKHSYKEFKN